MKRRQRREEIKRWEKSREVDEQKQQQEDFKVDEEQA